MKIETAYTAHPGGRDEQQDAVAVLERPDGGECLVVLADGMGGHAGGSLASRTVVETAERVWQDDGAPGEPRALLAHICQSAHDAINQAGEDQNLSPRSTCVLLHLRGGMAHWAHVGDSRLYRFRDGAQLGRTRDHSVVQMLLDMGKISEEEMGTHPDQNRLTQSLGGDTDPEPDFGSDEAREGDGYILCSDGLWEMVKPDEMAGSLAEKALDGLPETLAATAFDRAGRHSDNISVAIVRLGGPVAAAAVAAGEAPTRVVAAGAAVGAKRPRSGGGRLAIAFLLVGVLAVGAAAALVRPWEEDPYPADRPRDALTVPGKEAMPGERRKVRPLPDDGKGDRTAPAPTPAPKVPAPKTPDSNVPAPKRDASRQPAPRPAPDSGARKPSRPDASPPAEATPRNVPPPEATPPEATPPGATRPDARVQPPTETQPQTQPKTVPETAPRTEPAPPPQARPAPKQEPSPQSPPGATPPAKPDATDPAPSNRSETRPPADPAPEVIRPGPPDDKSRVRQPTDPSSKAE